MTRTAAREVAVRLVYTMNANECEPEQLLDGFFESEYFSTLEGEDELYKERPDEKQMEYIRRLVNLCYLHNYEFSGYMGRYSRGWKPERISSTAAAIIRCAMCEVLYMEDVPNSAAINEAVELAKSYDEPETAAFVNGVLGGFMRGEGFSADLPEEFPETACETPEEAADEGAPVEE